MTVSGIGLADWSYRVSPYVVKFILFIYIILYLYDSIFFLNNCGLRTADCGRLRTCGLNTYRCKNIAKVKCGLSNPNKYHKKTNYSIYILLKRSIIWIFFWLLKKLLIVIIMTYTMIVYFSLVNTY